LHSTTKHLTGRHNSEKKRDSKLQHELQKFARSILPVTQQNYFELLETTSKVLGFKQKKGQQRFAYWKKIKTS